MPVRWLLHCLQPQLLVFLTQFRHREDVGPPEFIALAPVDGGHYLLLGPAVVVEHEAGGVAPSFRDGWPLAAVGFDAVGEVLAEPVGIEASRLRGRFFNLYLFYTCTALKNV
jgi:hypothetical protein